MCCDGDQLEMIVSCLYAGNYVHCGAFVAVSVCFERIWHEAALVTQIQTQLSAYLAESDSSFDTHQQD